MSFFKDFKADFTQAMNELMPDGNEMYDEDIEEAESPATDEAEEQVASVADESVDEDVLSSNQDIEELLAALTAKTETKSTKPLKTTNKKNNEAVEESIEESMKEGMKVPAEEMIEDAALVDDELEIAPEDMSDQIDSLLENELYSDEPLSTDLINDDTDVNTMDMSVEELLKQLDAAASLQNDIPAKREADENVDLEDEIEVEFFEEELPEVADERDMEDDLEAVTIGTIVEEPEEIMEEAMEEEPVEVMEEIMEEIMEEEPVEVMEEAVEEEPEEVVEEAMEEELVEVMEEAVEEEPEEVMEEAMEEEPVEVMEEAMEEEPVEVMEEAVEEEPEEVMVEVMEEEPEEVMVESVEEEPEEIMTEGAKEPDFVKDENREEKVTKTIENVEDNMMGSEKDVISIKSVEETKASAILDEKNYEFDESDAETTYITKGTKIDGNLQTDGSIDVIGTVNGDIDCKGKVVVGGVVTGSIAAGELYCNSAKIEGNIRSYGSVKVGVGSMIIGNIEGESAVIAGAVNGDIDVKGPVIVDSTAVIMGNIKSRSVQINNGAVIEGFCSQSYSDIDVKSFFA